MAAIAGTASRRAQAQNIAQLFTKQELLVTARVFALYAYLMKKLVKKLKANGVPMTQPIQVHGFEIAPHPDMPGSLIITPLTD